MKKEPQALSERIAGYYKKNWIPAYFYDLSEIKSNIHKISRNLPKQVMLYYAMKANSNPSVLKTIAKSPNIGGIEIASGGELSIAKKYVNSKQIIFTGPGKAYKELERSVKSKIGLINVESVIEAIRIDEIAAKLKIDKVDILIRINLNYSIENAQEKMSGVSTKMGIDEDDFYKSYDIIKTLSRINVKGIHVFAASGILDYKQLLICNKYIFNLVKQIEKYGINIDIIDFGGGIGVDYSGGNRVFDICKYNQELGQLIEEFNVKDKKVLSKVS